MWFLIGFLTYFNATTGVIYGHDTFNLLDYGSETQCQKAGEAWVKKNTFKTVKAEYSCTKQANIHDAY